LEREISLDAKFAWCEIFVMNLGQWMSNTGTRLNELADELGKPVSTVHGWKSGRRTPSAADLALIEKVTGGAVTVHDFVRVPAAA